MIDNKNESYRRQPPPCDRPWRNECPCNEALSPCQRPSPMPEPRPRPMPRPSMGPMPGPGPERMQGRIPERMPGQMPQCPQNRNKEMMCPKSSYSSRTFSATSMSNRPDSTSGNTPDANSRRECMQKIYEFGFVLTETLLYLDTHPNDEAAMEYFAEMKEKYRQHTDMYTKMYGPLNFLDVTDENYWTWVMTPMPWE